ncbi:TonB-dependent receptor [Prevotella sp.]|jgi:TonB-dependent receptor|uniref:TonB-dependent receptor n=1 Tax=uncultured Prevotella sp. TaxID=159272 RepID=UPI0025FC7BEA|nr:TonB-dependent receptor [Prevotella sp.]MCI7372411.1 TonB-dependent receptor [Prevotella sp.]MDD6197683.1 TonB-dependent receptor [Prevotella sp.]
MKQFILSAVLIAASATVVSAHTLDGIVKDNRTGEPLIGSVVEVKELPSVKTTTGLDGSFTLHELPDKGRYTLVVRYISYKTREIPVEVSDKGVVTITLDEDLHQLGEVVIKGHKEYHSDRSAIDMEKTAGNVLNVMSQQSIQLSPDVNVASVLQRVSGVTMERDASGEASYAILRGMDKRYNYTLVNGVKIPSPDDKNRYIPLNIFPSDLMDRLVVSKSLTADMEGDAAGGVVDMVMKDAPSHFQIQANAAVGTSDYFWKDSRDYLTSNRSDYTHKAPYEVNGPEYKAATSDFSNGPTQISRHSMPAPNFVGGLSIGNRFWKDRIGVMLAGSIQNTFRGTERTYNSVKMASGEQSMYISSLQHRYYSIHDFTAGVHAKVDLQLENNKLEWYNMYVCTNSKSVRYNNSVNTEYISSDSYTQDDETRSLSQTQSIFATHLKGTHHLTKDFTADWAGIFSQAKAEDPDRVYLSLTNTVQSADGVDGSLWSGNKNILKTLPKNMERRFQHNTDKDWAGYINLAYNSQLGNDINALWKAGAQYRRKERGNRYYSYIFNPSDISQKLDGNGFDQFAAIDWTCKTPYSQASQLNYDSKEHIGAAYIMTTLKSRWGELNAGVRAEHTNQIYTMLQKFRNMGQVGEQSYWDWLPSASIKWTPTKKMNVRLSYYRSINRPGFYEIVPYQIMGEEYQEKGNPNLKRARIDNVDLRWEWFPSATEQVLAGVFYKYLQDPIEQVFVAADGKLGSGADAYYMPDNLGNAKNYGFEIDVVKYIRHFGIKANYTYTHSTITTTKREYKEGSAEYKTGVTQTRPLVNQAPHTANLSLLYKDTNYGWNAQLAASYTGTKLALVSPFKDADQWDKAMFGLDFSMEKKFPCGVSVFLKANNLLDAKRERYLKTVNQSNLEYEGQRSDKTIVGTYKYGRTFLIGVRVKM